MRNLIWWLFRCPVEYWKCWTPQESAATCGLCELLYLINKLRQQSFWSSETIWMHTFLKRFNHQPKKCFRSHQISNTNISFAYIKQSEIFAPLPPHKSENMKLFYSFAIGYFIDWNKNVGWSCNYRYRTLVINLFDPNLPKDVLANNSAITTVEYLVGAAKFACMQYGWMRMHWTGNQWLLNWEWRQITSVSRLQIWCIPTRDHRLDVRPKNMLNRIICISVLSGTRWLRSH